ncbi:hypothetical protein TNIN_388551 [Trichonephila inaurata madagascariensis]|uniref:Uncharacterized protein n=1 Tax=Trichonephila inaurata madagascariensis TaxID=2747483 RepID=A0A8X6J4R2_9ARAC|nr:hypothetical protein TNIN_388551 [Trichonephila inaurata madagascariensis]
MFIFFIKTKSSSSHGNYEFGSVKKTDPQAPWSGQVDLCHERPRFSSVTTGRLLGPGGRRVETDAPPLTQPTPTSPSPTSCSTPHANQPPPTRYYDPPGVYARTHATHARWKTTGTWVLDPGFWLKIPM